MSTLLHLIAITTFVVACKSSPITDKIEKCELTDEKCLANLYNTFLKEAATNGIPELGIPVVDPYIIDKIEILPFGLLNITLFDGMAKGIATCHVASISIDIEMERKSAEVLCDTFSVEGSYTTLPTAALKSLIGNVDIHGNGKAGFTAEKIKLMIDYAFEVKKLDDGEIHFMLNMEDTTYTLKVLGDIHLKIENLYIGSQEISGVVMKVLTENKDAAVRIFGSVIGDRVVDIISGELNKMDTKIPASDLIKTDLSHYVKN